MNTTVRANVAVRSSWAAWPGTAPRCLAAGRIFSVGVSVEEAPIETCDAWRTSQRRYVGTRARRRRCRTSTRRSMPRLRRGGAVRLRARTPLYVCLDGIVLKQTWSGEVRHVCWWQRPSTPESYRDILGIPQHTNEQRRERLFARSSSARAPWECSLTEGMPDSPQLARWTLVIRLLFSEVGPTALTSSGVFAILMWLPNIQRQSGLLRTPLTVVAA